MNYEIQDIEGIGPAYGEKLGEVGIKTTEDFLKHCCDTKGRKTIEEQTGLGHGLILKWANQADLMRISGIGPQYAELLQASGVDTVKELRQRNADNLATKMAEINGEKNLAKTSPASTMITNWIEKAQTTDPVITH